MLYSKAHFSSIVLPAPRKATLPGSVEEFGYVPQGAFPRRGVGEISKLQFARWRTAVELHEVTADQPGKSAA